MPLLSYFHSAVLTSYSSGLWLGLPISWLYSIGVLSFCPLLSKISLFLLKKRSAEYLLNQSVPTNRAALGASIIMRSTGTLVLTMARGSNVHFLYPKHLLSQIYILIIYPNYVLYMSQVSHLSHQYPISILSMS